MHGHEKGRLGGSFVGCCSERRALGPEVGSGKSAQGPLDKKVRVQLHSTVDRDQDVAVTSRDQDVAVTGHSKLHRGRKLL
jgi:hypothetical protein